MCINWCVLDKSIDSAATTLDDLDPILEEQSVETSAKFWRQSAQSILRQHLHVQPNTNVAKNVIFFLGDGMSVPTVVAARTYLGQLQGKSGEESQLSFEQFPYVGLSKVRCKI